MLPYKKRSLYHIFLPVVHCKILLKSGIYAYYIKYDVKLQFCYFVFLIIQIHCNLRDKKSIFLYKITHKKRFTSILILNMLKQIELIATVKQLITKGFESTLFDIRKHKFYICNLRYKILCYHINRF